MFVNGGKSITPHAILEVRTGTGDLIWRFDRDGRKPVQVISEQVALDMSMMLNSAAEQGTGRRAMLPRHPDRRQDRHHQRLSRCLVRRLHRQLHRRRLVRQRRLPGDQPHDRRLAAGDDLAADHAARARGHRAASPARRQAAARRAPGRPPTSRRGPVDPAARQYVLTRRGAEILTRVERTMDDVNRALAARDTPGKPRRPAAAGAAARQRRLRLRPRAARRPQSANIAHANLAASRGGTYCAPPH